MQNQRLEQGQSRVLLKWATAFLLTQFVLLGAYHLSLEASPRRVAIVVDSSFPMRVDWHMAQAALESLSNARYTLFALFTEKTKVHGYAATLSRDLPRPFAPRNLNKLQALRTDPDLADADQVFFITNARRSSLQEFEDWTIVRPSTD